MANLSKWFFYALVLLLPFQTGKVFFTSQSFYFGYHAFYNTIWLYLTDLLFLCLMLVWIWESNRFTPSKAEGFSPEKNPSPTLPSCPSGRRASGEGGVFPRILTRISQDKIYWFLATFWLILATSLIFSRENFLGLYGLLRITQGMLILAYLRENFSFAEFSRENTPSSLSPSPREGGERVGVIFWLILASSWIQAGIGIIQYLSQKSLGLRLLGEEFLRPGLGGIAEFVSSGIVNPVFYKFFPYLSAISDGPQVAIRAYGTFPHPNVLAAFLFFGLMINLYLFYRSGFSTPSSLSPSPREGGEREGVVLQAKILILSLSLLITSTGLVVTFSRLAWAVALGAIIVWFGLILGRVRTDHLFHLKTGRLNKAGLLGQYFPGKLAWVGVTLLVFLGINWFLFGEQIQDRLGVSHKGWSSIVTEESFANRETLNLIALRMVKQNPIFGVGLRNFVVEMDGYAGEKLLPYLHQPVHNLYLLIAAEAGILALFVFVVVLYYILRSTTRHLKQSILRYSLVLTFFGFLVLGFFDHYLWTIQQGSLMLWMMLGLVSAKEEKNDL